MDENDYLTVGRIVRPHGIKGQVEIYSLTDYAERFAPGADFKLDPPVEGFDRVTLGRLFAKKDRLVSVIVGVENRSAAETLTGCNLLIPANEGVKPDDTYWHHEIIGCEVVTVDGVSLGRVVEIMRTGGNDVYVVDSERRHYIPAIKDVIKDVDIEGGRIVITPLPGLLEI